MSTPSLRDATWERMIQAVEKVRDWCARAVLTLEMAGIPHAVAGGHAVANWVESIDSGVVRNTRDVDILIDRSDFEAVKTAMETAGFAFGSSYGEDFCLDGPEAKSSERIHLLYAGEKVNRSDPIDAPQLVESELGAAFRVVSLEALVRMKLVANRDKDRTHIRDLIGVGLIDASWPDRFPAILAERLRFVLNDPDG